MFRFVTIEFDLPCRVSPRNFAAMSVSELADVLRDHAYWERRLPYKQMREALLASAQALDIPSPADIMASLANALPRNGRFIHGTRYASEMGELSLQRVTIRDLWSTSDGPKDNVAMLLHWTLQILTETPVPDCRESAEELVMGVLPACYTDQEFVLEHEGVAGWVLTIHDVPQNFQFCFKTPPALEPGQEDPWVSAERRETERLQKMVARG